MRRSNVMWVVAVAMLALPASVASADGRGAPASSSIPVGGGGGGPWTITVTVHGSGVVLETSESPKMNCQVPFGQRTAESTFDCVQGGYVSGIVATVVRLEATVTDSAHFARGWRFASWAQSRLPGEITCEQATAGDPFNPVCTFVIDRDLHADLYFVDVEGPQDTSFSGGPSGVTKQTSAAFANFEAPSDPDAGFQCRLDTPRGIGNLVPCGDAAGDRSETYDSLLTNGAYAFNVFAVDPSGNADEKPASREWTVDTIAPALTIADGPADGSSVASPSATFTIASNDGTLACVLDGAPKPCGGAYPGLTDGQHTLSVTATDAAGNVASASRRWTVDTVTPDTLLLDGPAQGSTSPTSSATFAFSSPEAGARFECRLDDETFAGCESPLARTRIHNGDRTFEVRAVDAAGNADATPAQRGWRVNNLDDDADGFNRPQDCDDANPAIHPGAADTFDNGVDEDCSGADAHNLDADGDGFSRPQDCNDAAATIHPGARDTFDNGVDEDCSGADAHNLDGDRDGYNVPQDCADRDASIHPGAADKPGNKIDEDCSGSDAQFQRLDSSIFYAFRFGAKRTTTSIAALSIQPARGGSTVRMSCTGRGCPFKLKTLKIGKDSRRFNLVFVLRKAKLRPGAVLEVRVTKPGTVGVSRSLAIRRKRPPLRVDRCLPPGTAKPVTCPL